MRSVNSPALSRGLILPSLLALAMLSSGCAGKRQALTIPLADTFREACPRPDVPAFASVGDLGAFIIRQEAAISICDERRAGIVGIIDAANEK